MTPLTEPQRLDGDKQMAMTETTRERLTALLTDEVLSSVRRLMSERLVTNGSRIMSGREAAREFLVETLRDALAPIGEGATHDNE